MNARSYSDPEVEPLRKALLQAFSDGLDNIFRHAGTADEVVGDLKPLADVIKARVGGTAWKQDPQRATIDSVKLAIDTKVDEKMSGRNPERLRSKAAGNFWKGLLEREYALMLAGFKDDELVAKHGCTGRITFDDHRRPIFFTLSGLDKHKSKRYLPLMIICQDIAVGLLELADEVQATRDHQGIQDVETTADTIIARDTYIQRLELEAKLETLLTASHACVWVHGEPGAGKTILVERVLKRLGLRAHWIDAWRTDTLEKSIALTLDSLGAVAGRVHPAVAVRHISNVYSDPDYRETTLVVDNLDHLQWPELIPRAEPLPRVIIISRYPPPSNWRSAILHVEDLTDEQALALAGSILTQEAEGQLLSACEKVGNRALAVFQICKTIQYSGVDVGSYINSVDLVRKLRDTTRKDSNLVSHYAYLCDEAIDLPSSFKLLDLLCSITLPTSLNILKLLWSEIYPDRIQKEIWASRRDSLRLIPHRLISTPPAPPFGWPVTFHISPDLNEEVDSAIGELVGLGICTQASLDDCDDYSIIIHPLTHQLICEQRKKMQSDACRLIVSALVQHVYRAGHRNILPLSAHVLALASEIAYVRVCGELLYKSPDALMLEENVVASWVLMRLTANRSFAFSTSLFDIHAKVAFMYLTYRTDPGYGDSLAAATGVQGGNYPGFSAYVLSIEIIVDLATKVLGAYALTRGEFAVEIDLIDYQSVHSRPSADDNVRCIVYFRSSIENLDDYGEFQTEVKFFYSDRGDFSDSVDMPPPPSFKAAMGISADGLIDIVISTHRQVVDPSHSDYSSWAVLSDSCSSSLIEELRSRSLSTASISITNDALERKLAEISALRINALEAMKVGDHEDVISYFEAISRKGYIGESDYAESDESLIAWCENLRSLLNDEIYWVRVRSPIELR